MLVQWRSQYKCICIAWRLHLACIVCSNPIQSNSIRFMWVFLHLSTILLNPIDSIYCSNFDPIFVHKTFSKCIRAHEMNGPFTHFNFGEGWYFPVHIVAALAWLPLCPCYVRSFFFFFAPAMEQHIFVIFFAYIFYILRMAAAAAQALTHQRKCCTRLWCATREKKNENNFTCTHPPAQFGTHFFFSRSSAPCAATRKNIYLNTRVEHDDGHVFSMAKCYEHEPAPAPALCTINIESL